MTPRPPRHGLHRACGMAASLVIVASTTACNGSPDASEVGVRTRTDTAGPTIRVVNRGTPPTWTLELAWEVGAPGGAGQPGPEEFGRVHGLAVDAEGSLWIGDAQASEVRRFGPGGEFLVAFGRRGQGPGEMQSLQSLAWLAPDTLALLDSAQGRVLLFDPSGEPLGQIPYPGGVTGPPAVVRLFQIPDGAFAFAPDAGGGQRFLHYTTAGEGGSLPRRRPDDLDPAAAVCPLPDGAIRFYTNPFAPDALLRPLARDRVLEARTDSLRLAVVDQSGDTLRVITDSVPRVPLRDPVWDSAMAEYVEFRRENPGIPCDPEPVRPRLLPPLVDLHLDASGRIWAELRVDEGREVRIYEPDGRLIARSSAPRRQDRIPPAFAPGWMAVLAEGPLGEDVVRAYRIRESPPVG